MNQSVATPALTPAVRSRQASDLYVAAALVFAGCAVLPPAWRVLVLPALLVLFALAHSRRPLAGTAFLIVTVGLPLYISLGGSDAGTVTVALIWVAWLVDLFKSRLARVPQAVLPLALVLVPAVAAVVRLQGTAVGRSSLRMTIALVAGVLLAHLIVSHVADRRGLRVVLTALALMVCLQALVAMAQAAGLGTAGGLMNVFAPRDAEVDAALNLDGSLRARGLIGQYELLAEWCAALFVVLVAVAASGGRRRRLAVAGALLCAGGVVATASRAGLVAAAAGLVTFGVLVTVRRRGLDLRVAAVVVAVVLAAVFAVAVLVPTQAETVISRFGYTGQALQAGASGVSLLNRGTWSDLPASLTAWTPAGNGLYRLALVGEDSMHSLWFTVRYAFGVAGTVGLAWLLVLVGYRVLLGVSRSAEDADGYLCSGLLAGLVTILASQVVVEFLRTEPTMAFFCAYLGACVAASRVLPRGPAAGGVRRS